MTPDRAISNSRAKGGVPACLIFVSGVCLFILFAICSFYVQNNIVKFPIFYFILLYPLIFPCYFCFQLSQKSQSSFAWFSFREIFHLIFCCLLFHTCRVLLLNFQYILCNFLNFPASSIYYHINYRKKANPHLSDLPSQSCLIFPLLSLHIQYRYWSSNILL